MGFALVFEEAGFIDVGRQGKCGHVLQLTWQSEAKMAP
jgi:hypothetical protein